MALLRRTRRVRDIRVEKVVAIRRALARGQYDPDVHLDAILDDLSDDIGMP